MDENSEKQKEQERMQELNYTALLMLTPLDKLPAMPTSIQNEDNVKLGGKILELLEQEKISFGKMDKNGLLEVNVY